MLDAYYYGHDVSYYDQGASGVSGAFCDLDVRGADAELAVGAATIALDPFTDPLQKLAATVTALLFGVISGYKEVISACQTLSSEVNSSGYGYAKNGY